MSRQCTIYNAQFMRIHADANTGTAQVVTTSGFLYIRSGFP